MSINVKPLTAAAILLSLMGVGCGSDDKRAATTGTDTTGAADGSTQATPAPAAKVKFVAPEVGAAVSGQVTAKVELSGFVIDPKAVGTSPQPGRGHLHFSMDNGKYDHAKYSGENGKLAEQLGVDGKYSPSITPAITYSNLPPGEHELEVYLANNNHTDTGVEAKTSFTVK